MLARELPSRGKKEKRKRWEGEVRRQDSLLSGEELPESHDAVGARNSGDGLHLPCLGFFALLNDPVLRDEAVNHPSQAKGECQEHADVGVHEYRVEGMREG